MEKDSIEFDTTIDAQKKEERSIQQEQQERQQQAVTRNTKNTT